MSTDDEPLWLVRTAEGFNAATALDREMIAKWGVGSVVRARLTKPRSGKQQRLYWAILRVVAFHQERYATPEALHLMLKVRFGMVDRIEVGQETVIVPQSTDYDSMEAGAFNEHVDRTLRLIWGEIFPGMDAAGRKEMLAEIDAMTK